jgi:predicted dehydrogenase
MRGLVVGLGSIGRRHARNWAALELGPLGVCRQLGAPQPEPLGVEAQEYRDLDQALADEQPDIVIVANPTSLHVETAREALQAGAHVLVEKPIGHTLAGVHELIELAENKRKHVLVGYNLRFHPGLQRVRELLSANAVGRVVSARAEAGEYLPDWHPWEDYTKGYAARRDLGGGALLTLSHELDSLCWLLGAPRRVLAVVSHASSLEFDADDVAELVLQFVQGHTASVHVDYVRRPPKRALEIVGEEGVLRWEYDANVVRQYTPITRQWRVEEGDPKFQRNDTYVTELRHFVACVRGEIERPLIDGKQAAAILLLALAAQRSSADGRAIDLETEGQPATAWLSSLGRA